MSSLPERLYPKAKTHRRQMPQSPARSCSVFSRLGSYIPHSDTTGPRTRSLSNHGDGGRSACRACVDACRCVGPAAGNPALYKCRWQKRLNTASRALEVWHHRITKRHAFEELIYAVTPLVTIGQIFENLHIIEVAVPTDLAI